jgi:YcxB-like protein
MAGLVFLISNGDRSWVVGFLGTVGGMVVFFLVLLYVIHYRNAMHKFRAMGDPEATLVASEESFSVSSGIGSSTVRWASITEIWQFPTFWLLFFSKAQFIADFRSRSTCLFCTQFASRTGRFFPVFSASEGRDVSAF